MDLVGQGLLRGRDQEGGASVGRRQIDAEPIRNLGEFNVHVRLTVDLIPSIKVFVYREGEAIPTQGQPEAAKPEAATPETAKPEAAAEPEPATPVEPAPAA